jgi:hypothetical protein
MMNDELNDDIDAKLHRIMRVAIVAFLAVRYFSSNFNNYFSSKRHLICKKNYKFSDNNFTSNLQHSFINCHNPLCLCSDWHGTF